MNKPEWAARAKELATAPPPLAQLLYQNAVPGVRLVFEQAEAGASCGYLVRQRPEPRPEEPNLSLRYRGYENTVNPLLRTAIIWAGSIYDGY